MTYTKGNCWAETNAQRPQSQIANPNVSRRFRFGGSEWKTHSVDQITETRVGPEAIQHGLSFGVGQL